jgi:predicted nucleic acid-binding protein
VRPIAVLDSSVVVSGIGWSRGKARAVLILLAQRGFISVRTPWLTAEWADVTHRVSQEVRWANPNWPSWLDWLKHASLLLDDPPMNRIVRRDPKDDPVVAAAVSGGAQYLVIGVIHFVYRKKFLAISFEPERAVAEGLRVRWWDFLFYILFGFVVTSFVQIGGVLMIFSYLIVPAVCASFLASRLRSLLLIGWLTATLSSIAGLYFSYHYDLPTGAAIICVLGLALLLAALVASLKRRLRAGS